MPSRLFTCMPLDHATQGCHCQICSRDISTRTPLGCAGCGSGPELCKDLRGCLAEVPITPCVPSWNPALWAQAVDLDPSYAKASEAVWQRYPSRTVSPFEALPCGRRPWIWTRAMQRPLRLSGRGTHHALCPLLKPYPVGAGCGSGPKLCKGAAATGGRIRGHGRLQQCCSGAYHGRPSGVVMKDISRGGVAHESWPFATGRHPSSDGYNACHNQHSTIRKACTNWIRLSSRSLHCRAP